MYAEDDPDPKMVYGKNHPLAGKRIKMPMCKKPCKQGSSHWCDEHYKQAVEEYGTGIIIEH